MMTKQRIRGVGLSLGLVVIGACGGAGSEAMIPEEARPDAAPSADATPSSSTAAEYASVSEPAGTFHPDQEGDFQVYWGTVAEGPPTDQLYLELYEGFGTFSNEEGAVEFDGVQLPLVVDFGASATERDIGSCGTCVSVLMGVTIVEGETVAYERHLVAQSGTLEITALPTAAGGTFTATLQDLEMVEVDDSGVVVPEGYTTVATRLEITTTAGP